MANAQLSRKQGNNTFCCSSDTAAPSDPVQTCLQLEFEAARSEMEREAKRAAKIEQKVGILVNGLQQRDAKLRAQADGAWAALQMELVNLECFKVSVRLAAFNRLAAFTVRVRVRVT